jgi:DNA repair protein RadC
MKQRRLSLKELPEEERPRERLIRHSAHSLSDAELLAIILAAGTREESAVQLAQRIINEAGNLKALSEMSVEELKTIHGIGSARATQLKAAFELSRRYRDVISQSKTKFSDSQMVFTHFSPGFRGKNQEEFWVIALDAKNRLLHSALISKGTLMGSMVHPP